MSTEKENTKKKAREKAKKRKSNLVKLTLIWKKKKNMFYMQKNNVV